MATLGQVMVEIGADLKDFDQGMKRAEAEMSKLTRELVGDSAALSASLEMMSKQSAKGFMTLEERMNLIRDAMVRSNDIFQAKATQSEKMIKRLAAADVRGLDRQFLKIAASMDQLAKRGNVLNLAIQNVGRNASLKTLLDEIKYITQGIARMQGAAMAAGIAFTVMTVALFKAAQGPKPGDVLAQQAALMKQFTDQLNQRADDIYNFAGLFENVTVKAKVSGNELIKILQNQVTVLANWSKNLQILAKRGVDQGLIAELQKMGPQAAAQVQALVNMSDKQLNQYVNLWREKHRLARTEAMSELDQLRQQTQQKIKELGATVTNLGKSLEKFKQTWASALKPFVKFWGDVAAKVVDAGTAFGNFLNKLNQINPLITQMGGMILYLATGFTVLLSPLAIGISRAGSFAAAFSVLWSTIGPVVTGLLSVAGTALLLAAAIVVVGVALNRIWKNSEAFRNALIGVWNGIKQAFVSAFQPILPAFDRLKKAFKTLVSAFTGDGGNMASIWRSIGNVFADVINTVASVLLPIFRVAFTVAARVVEGAVNILVIAFNLIADWWKSNGPGITSIISTVWGYVKAAFQEVGAFIMSKVPQIARIVSKEFQLIAKVIQTVVPIIQRISTAFWTVIMPIVSFLMPYLVSGFKNAWATIKSVISSSLNIIEGILNFFLDLLNGNWTGAWNDLKGIASNVLNLVIALVKNSFIGQIIGVIVQFAGELWSWISSAWNTAAGYVSSALGVISSICSTVWNAIASVISGVLFVIAGIIATVWNTIVAIIQVAWTIISVIIAVGMMFIENIIIPIFQVIWNFIVTCMQAIWNVISTVWNAIAGVISTVITTIWGWISPYWNMFVTIITTACQAIWGVITAIWNGIVSFLSAIWHGIVSIASSVWHGLVSVLSSIWNSIRSMASSVWNSIRSTLSSIWNSIRGTASSIWNGIKSVLSSIWNSMRSSASSIWNGIKSMLSSIWNSIRSTASSVWNSVKNAMTRPIQEAKSTILGIISAIKGAFARMSIHIPKPKLPHIVVGSSSVMGVSYPTFSLKWYAKGGVFDKASVVGIGEAGDEAVLPLSNKRRMRPFAYTVADLIAQRESKAQNSASGGIHIHVAQLVVREEADIVKIAEKLHRLQQIKQRMGGVQFAD